MQHTTPEDIKARAFKRRWDELTIVEQKIVEPFKESGDMLQAYAYLGSPSDPIYDVYFIPFGAEWIKKVRSNDGMRYAIERRWKKKYNG